MKLHFPTESLNTFSSLCETILKIHILHCAFEYAFLSGTGCSIMQRLMYN